MATKLHELLAVESNLENQATKTRTDLINTFTSKRHLFAEKRVTFRPLAEGTAEQTEEQSDIQSTVASEIKWVNEIAAKALDASHQIDVANTIAKADVVTEDGKTVLTGLPATSLLQLEKRLKEIHDLVVAIPTLDPAKGFEQDAARPEGVFKARDVVKPRTKKTIRPLILYEATKEHPAQVKEVSEDLEVGTVLHQEWCSLITPAKKSDLIDRCDRLIRAVKRARARANEQEVDVKDNKVGEKLLEYVFYPLNGAK